MRSANPTHRSVQRGSVLHGGLHLERSPSVRDEARSRRRRALAWIAALALGGTALGFIATPRHAVEAAATGPFSYFPSE